MSNNNQRRNKGGGGAKQNNTNRKNNGGGQQQIMQYPDMTILCHRVDLFDDFVPSNSGNNGKTQTSYEGGLVPIRCLGLERGCACHTPCVFCHTVVEDEDDDLDANTNQHTEAPEGVPAGLAFLFAGNDGADDAKKTPPPPNETAETTNTTKLIIDPIFAKNYGLYDGSGVVKVKKYHHPPVGRFNFDLPLQELPAFFDQDDHQNGHEVQHHVQPKPVEVAAAASGSNGSNEDGGAGLDSFFDDFAIAPAPPPPAPVPENKHSNANILVFRTPLKTVVKKTIKSTQSDSSGKCLCQCRYENLKAGNSQPNPHDPSVVHDKYWAQRRRLFKKFDEGIELDAEGWYSVTPEVVADHVASRFQDASQHFKGAVTNNANGRNARKRRGQQSSKPMVILDAFCGCGGNAIAFAKLPPSVVSHIICIDVDRTKLRKAAHNASIYGIAPNRIIFVEANSVAVMERYYRDGTLVMDPPEISSEYPPREVYDDFTIGGIDVLNEIGQRIDCIFMDPPWGGIDYNSVGKDGYDLARDMKIRGCERGCIGFPPTPEVDGIQLLKVAAAATRTRFVVYDLPRNTNKRSLAEAALEAGYEGNGKLEEHYINSRLKTVTAYFGQDFRHLLDLKKYQEESEGGH